MGGPDREQVAEEDEAELQDAEPVRDGKQRHARGSNRETTAAASAGERPTRCTRKWATWYPAAMGSSDGAKYRRTKSAET